MNKIGRIDGDYYGVIKEDGFFKVAIFNSMTVNMHSVNNSNAYWIYDTEFTDKELAFRVCEMLADAFKDGVNDV